MIIEIDDAGTGDPVGEPVIGLYIPEKNLFLYDIIPIELYSKEKFSEHAPQKKAAEIVAEKLKEIGFDPKRDVIRICSGNIFDLTRKYFEENNIRYENAKITGRLQELVERMFINNLKKIGVKRDLPIEGGRIRTLKLLSWVSGDFFAREKFVKKGFPIWEKKWKEICLKRYTERKKKRQQNKHKRSRKNLEKKGIRSRNPKGVVGKYKDGNVNPENSKDRDTADGP